MKAQLISNDSVQAGESYEFPTKSDDLTNFTHGSAQIMFSNALLRGVLDQLPPSECSYYGTILCNSIQMYSCISSQWIPYFICLIDTTTFPITNTILRDDILQLPNPRNG